MTAHAERIGNMKALYSPKSARDVLADMPELARFRERLLDPSWPTPQEVAEARAALAIDPTCPQSRLVLELA